MLTSTTCTSESHERIFTGFPPPFSLNTPPEHCCLACPACVCVPASHLLAASAPRVDPSPAQSNQQDPHSQQPQAARVNQDVQMNAQGGEILNEEELNRDWLDWVYTVSRAVILLSVVYFYSSFSRFVMVMVAMLVLYL